MLAWVLAAAALPAADLSPLALRIVGQLKPHANGLNLVEGRELASPSGLAVDLNSAPARLYVADTGNHRVLGWRDAARFASGAAADLVIGQPDFFGATPNAGGTAVGLWQPSGLAVDASGNLYIADTGNHRVVRYPRPFEQRVQASDLVIGQSSPAGQERNMGLAAASEFTLSSPGAVAVGPRGELAVADTGNHRVLLFGPATPASSGLAAFSVLGQPSFLETTPAALNAPAGISFDALGRLWVASPGSHRVVQFAAPWAGGRDPLRILGGNPATAPRTAQTLLRPAGVASSGDDLWIADTGNHRLLRFSGLTRSSEPRPAADALFGQPDFFTALPNGLSRSQPLASGQSLWSPAQLAWGPNQDLLVADSGNHRVLVIPSSNGRYQQASRVLGQDNFRANAANLVEGREVSTANLLATPQGPLAASGGMVVDSRGLPPHLYIADTINHRVLGWRDARSLREGASADLVIGQPDLATAVANFGVPAPDGRPATRTNLSRPSGLALDGEGNLLVADTGNSRVLRFPRPFEQAGGQPLRADLVIGHGVEGAGAYLLNRPTGIAVDPERGDLLVADTLNHRVLYFPAPLLSGMAATRVLGQTGFTESARGLSSAAMSLPTGVAFDSQNHIYVSDTGNSRILVFGPLRDLPSAGAAALASGPAPIGQPDFVTSAGATAANRLRNPAGLLVHPPTGDLWVADTANHRVLRFPPLAVLALNGGSAYPAGGLFGQLNFTARTPNLGASAAGQASAAGLNLPNTVALDGAGNLLVGDGNARVTMYFPEAVSVSAATFLAGAPLAPGMLASLFGPALGDQTREATLPLPVTLADTEVRINEAAAPLLYVSPGHINYQVPSSLEPGTVARVEVTRASTGRAVAGGTLLVAPAAAGIFALLNQDGSPNTASNPAARGSLIQIFATGQGLVERPPPDGSPALAAPLSETPSRPLVTIGTSSQRDVPAEFSGLAPGFVGLWQINARVPEATVPAARVPVLVRYLGSASNVVYIAVR